MEEKFDNAIHVMFEMEKRKDEVSQEVVRALKMKLKDAMLRSLRKNFGAIKSTSPLDVGKV